MPTPLFPHFYLLLELFLTTGGKDEWYRYAIHHNLETWQKTLVMISQTKVGQKA